MNIHDLRIAQAHFENQINDILESRKNLYQLRTKFAQYYNFDQIKSMPIDHYAIGNDLPKKGYNFYYTIERQLDGLGRIIGASSFKFGVYYGKTKSDAEKKYRFTKKFGINYTEAYENIKLEILNLLKFGNDEDIDGIVNNKISPMFKGKILCTYFPERYLNVFSDNHLKYFLVQFNIDTNDLIKSDAVIKREALITFKNKDDVMKNWPVDLFTYFLYQIYPGRPPKKEEGLKSTTPLEDYKNPNFPINSHPDWIEMSIEPPRSNRSTPKKGNGRENPDYEIKARKLKKLGDRGEKIVLEMERKRLKDLGLNELSNKIEKAKFDYLGYDIKSFEENGEDRYIEVKATRLKVGTANFFLSINELNTARELTNYYIYVVFDILSENPKIWRIKNPFQPKNKNVVIEPVSYRVIINASELNF